MAKVNCDTIYPEHILRFFYNNSHLQYIPYYNIGNALIWVDKRAFKAPAKLSAECVYTPAVLEGLKIFRMRKHYA